VSHYLPLLIGIFIVAAAHDESGSLPQAAATRFRLKPIVLAADNLFHLMIKVMENEGHDHIVFG
jgi:hypothetical protein